MSVTAGSSTVASAFAGNSECREFLAWASEIASEVGQDSKNIALAKAAINKAIRYINRYIWQHEFIQAVDVTLDGHTPTQTYELPFSTKAVCKAVILNADGTDGHAYTWAAPQIFEQARRNNDWLYSIQNMALNGLLSVSPIPGSAEDGKTLRLTLYRRTPVLSDNDSKLAATPEFEQVVEDIARYYFVRTQRNDNPAIVSDAKQYAFSQLNNFMMAEAASTDSLDINHVTLIAD